jgi:integrase
MPRLPKNVVAFTDRSIKALRAGPARVDYMASGKGEPEGFGLRVYPTGARTFFVRYRVGGGRRLRRFIIGSYPEMYLETARAKARALVGQVASGDDPQEERKARRKALTFGDLANSYLEVHAKKEKASWEEDERILKKDLLPAWRNRLASDIRRQDVAALLDRIVARGAPVMSNRVRALASKIFAFALPRGIVEYNPVHGVPPRKETSKERVLSAEEIRTLWACLECEGSVMAGLFKILLLTGQRSGVVLTMRWDQLDSLWWTIPKEVMKNRLGHRVFLSDQTFKVLAGLRERNSRKKVPSEWVFPSPRTKTHLVTVGNAVDRYHEKSGVVAWSPHDLRRTMATWMGRPPLTGC